VYRMGPTKRTVLFELELVWCCPLVFGRCIISVLAFQTCKRDYNSHPPTPSLLWLTSTRRPIWPRHKEGPTMNYGCGYLSERACRTGPPSLPRHAGWLAVYSIISLTTPAPTVRPPSRIAKRSSFSIAIGVISSADIVTLSPGITISTPSGKFNMPVTSVVRK